jgi:hypothetical protein
MLDLLMITCSIYIQNYHPNSCLAPRTKCVPLLKRGVCALQEAVDHADSPVAAAKWAGQLDVLQRRRAPLLARWQAAFDVLHVELKAIKAAITSFKAASAAGGTPEQTAAY